MSEMLLAQNQELVTQLDVERQEKAVCNLSIISFVIMTE
jgi:hypothetical protein